MARRWSDIKKGRVRRKAYAKLLLRCLVGADFGSARFFAKRVVTGDPHGRQRRAGAEIHQSG